MKQDCPFAKSPWTPCVIRDGTICYTLTSNDCAICVGCERGPLETDVDVDIGKLKRETAEYIRKTSKERR